MMREIYLYGRTALRVHRKMNNWYRKRKHFGSFLLGDAGCVNFDGQQKALRVNQEMTLTTPGFFRR